MNDYGIQLADALEGCRAVMCAYCRHVSNVHYDIADNPLFVVATQKDVLTMSKDEFDKIHVVHHGLPFCRMCGEDNQPDGSEDQEDFYDKMKHSGKQHLVEFVRLTIEHGLSIHCVQSPQITCGCS